MDKRLLKYIKMPLQELICIADKIRSKYAGSNIELCNILNARSGACPEDCKFCAQSCYSTTGAAVYPLKSAQEILGSARFAKKMGAHRFDIVTSGNRLSRKDFKKIARIIHRIRKDVGISMCASLGRLNREELLILKEAGLSRYHHNIETSERFFKRIVTTHSFQERIDTILAAKSTGLEVCSGGIIGMGENWEDRFSLALMLKKLNVDSVPLNILVPIKGTPLGNRQTLSCSDAIRTIAIFRIILRDKTIKIAAGRESVLKDFQAMGFMAGANGMLIGGYLTIKGRSIDEDWRLVKDIKQTWNQ
jgi:biotin synthase